MMDDLISRQAALDCFNDWVDRHGDVHSADEDVTYQKIEALPSAQPEQLGTNLAEVGTDCISRQEAIDALHMHLMYRMGTDSNKKRLDDWINSLPSVQPRPKGKWIPYSKVYENRNRCSECDYHLVGTPAHEANFCPNCGADMRGEQDDSSQE